MAKEDYLRGAIVLDAALEGRDYVVGNTFSLVDVVIGYVIVWAGWENLLETTPNLRRYRDLLSTRAAIPEALKSPPIDC